MTTPPTDFTHIEDLIALADKTSGTTSILYNDDHQRVILFKFEPDGGLEEHTAPHPISLHLIKGRAQISLGEKEIQAKAGTWAQVSPNIPHTIKAQEECYLLVNIIKPRE
ncbi:MAG: cupin domain-containing protein [Chloroflexota bacterium]